MFGLGGSWYSNRPARTHGFNAKIGFEKYATSPEISAKKCQILLVWFGRPILDTKYDFFLLLFLSGLQVEDESCIFKYQMNKKKSCNHQIYLVTNTLHQCIKGSEITASLTYRGASDAPPQVPQILIPHRIKG